MTPESSEKNVDTQDPIPAPRAIRPSIVHILQLSFRALRTEVLVSPLHSAILILVLLAVIATILSLSSSLLIALVLAVSAALAAGIFLTTRALITLLMRKIEILDGQNQDDSDNPAPSTTGLEELDQLLTEHLQHISSLHQKLDELSVEKDMLIHRYEVLTESLVAAIIIRDTSGKILYCSPYTEVLTGYSLYEIYAKEEDFFYSVIHPEDKEQYSRAHQISKYGEAFQFRYRFFHKTGIEMWAETRTVPILDEHGVITSSLSITLDVTAANRHQQQVEEKNRDLEDFSYMISHDLKAPIFTIKGMITLIEEDYQNDLPKDLTEPIEHISKANRRLEKLVASVLEYSRISTQTSQLEEVDLNAAIQEVHQDFSAQLETASGTLSIDGDFPDIIGDNLKIYQILSNLIGNAIKYRSEERPLTISISKADSQSERYFTLSIEDNGLGIPTEKLSEIFRPFQRAHGQEIEGSGIGLTCVKKLLEKLNGEIKVHSTEGIGSEFLVSFKKTNAGTLPAK